MKYSEITGKKLVESEALPDTLDQDGRGEYDPTTDKISTLSLDDTRKPKLTLKIINRLKKIRSTRDFELSKKKELLGIMYGSGGSGDDV